MFTVDSNSLVSSDDLALVFFLLAFLVYLRVQTNASPMYFYNFIPFSKSQ